MTLEMTLQKNTTDTKSVVSHGGWSRMLRCGPYLRWNSHVQKLLDPFNQENVSIEIDGQQDVREVGHCNQQSSRVEIILPNQVLPLWFVWNPLKIFRVHGFICYIF